MIELQIKELVTIFLLHYTLHEDAVIVGTLAYNSKDCNVIISYGIRNNKKHISEISPEISVHSLWIKIGVTCTKNRTLLKVCTSISNKTSFLNLYKASALWHFGTLDRSNESAGRSKWKHTTSQGPAWRRSGVLRSLLKAHWHLRRVHSPQCPYRTSLPKTERRPRAEAPQLQSVQSEMLRRADGSPNWGQRNKKINFY